MLDALLHGSPWMGVFLILILVSMDALLLWAAASVGAAFVAFKAWRAARQAIDNIVDRIVYLAFFLAGVLLDIPPLNRIPYIHIPLLAAKKAYGMANAAEALAHSIVSLVVTGLAISFGLAFALGLAAINLAILLTAIKCL